MKLNRSVWILIFVFTAILAASYFDQKDQESFDIEEQIRQSEFEAVQPK